MSIVTGTRRLLSPNHGGFTLAEVLLATAIVTIGLTAVAAGFHHALSAVEAGRQLTIALFLAEQRIEQVMAMALIDFDRVATGFPAEESVTGYPEYRRNVDVTPGPAGMAGAVLVQVTVAYRPLAPAPRRVTLATILRSRP
jgi:prepilin-type N-terminal cleavage/methylation domain-containing protein